MLELLADAKSPPASSSAEQVERWPETTARIAAEGHAIALHRVASPHRPITSGGQIDGVDGIATV